MSLSQNLQGNMLESNKMTLSIKLLVLQDMKSLIRTDAHGKDFS